MAVITVHSGGLGDYTTVSAAVSAATSVDIIELLTDITGDAVIINKNIAGIRGNIPQSSPSDFTALRKWDSDLANTPTIQILAGLSQPFFIEDLVIQNNDGQGSCLDIAQIVAGASFVFSRVGFERLTTVAINSIITIRDDLVAVDQLIIEECFIRGNTSCLSGLDLSLSILPNSYLIKNCVITDCLWASAGYGIWERQAFSASPVGKIYNCTIVNNQVGIGSGNGLDVKDSILSNADDLSLTGFANNSNYSYCAFKEQTDTGGFGSGCIFGITDSIFEDTGSYNYRVKAGSVTIDAGLDLSPINTVDLDGYSRPQGSAYDMGAYELTSGGPVTAQKTQEYFIEYMQEFGQE